MLGAAALFACAIVNLKAEWRIKRLADMQAPSGPIDPGDALLPYRLTSHDMTAREQLLSASIMANKASVQTGSARDASLLRANALLGAAMAGRPGWAQAEIMQAYVVGLARKGVNPQSSALIERSYRDAPFLDRQADWRIRYVVEAWPTASDALRLRAIEEAIWLSTESAAMYLHVKLLLERTPAYQPYLDRRRYLETSDQLSSKS